MKYLTIDVRELAPPEPMSLILQALSSLPAGQCLLVQHNRQPFPLYEKLTMAGWAYYCHESAIDRIQLYIYRQELQSEFDAFLPTQTLN